MGIAGVGQVVVWAELFVTRYFPAQLDDRSPAPRCGRVAT